MFRDIKEPAVLIETAGFLLPDTVQYRPLGVHVTASLEAVLHRQLFAAYN
jgi:hypothetical protein